MSGVDKLAEALERRRAQDGQSTFTTAQVVAGSTDKQVAVDMDGQTQTWPFVAGYTPRVGDAVVLGGGPGWWVCLGSISGVGPARASSQTVTDLEVTHDVAVGHELIAQGGMRTEAGLSSGGETAVGTVLSVGTRARSPNWSSSIYDGAVRWEVGGALEVLNYAGNSYRGVFASNFAPPPSWRSYKRDGRTLDEYLGASPGEVLDRLDLRRSWHYDPDEVPFADDVERIGPKLDEMPEGLLVHAVDAETGEDRSSWDLVSMLTVALAELQRLRRRVRVVEERLGTLSDRVTGNRTRSDNDRTDLRALEQRVAALETGGSS